jgi:hypothetical protein
MGMLTQSTFVATVIPNNNGHDDVTMPGATIPIYKELDTVPPFSSSDREQCGSATVCPYGGKKIEKRGGGFDFIF